MSTDRVLSTNRGSVLTKKQINKIEKAQQRLHLSGLFSTNEVFIFVNKRRSLPASHTIALSSYTSSVVFIKLMEPYQLKLSSLEMIRFVFSTLFIQWEPYMQMLYNIRHSMESTNVLTAKINSINKIQ